MITQKIFLLSLFCSIHCLYSTAFAAALLTTRFQKNQVPINNTPERIPLFIHAEECEENFIKHLTECSQNNTCNIHEAYQEARHDVFKSIIQLMLHLQNLEHDKEHISEKTEAKEIKNRLTELLMKNQ